MRFSDDHPAPRAARIKNIRAPKALANLHHPNGRYQKVVVGEFAWRVPESFDTPIARTSIRDWQ
jgi:hypothetical protein